MAQAYTEQNLDDTQRGLMAASFTPGPVGGVADILDGLMSAYRGDAFAASVAMGAGVLGVFGMEPLRRLLGPVRAAKMAAKYADDVAATRRVLKEILPGVEKMSDDDVLKIVRNMSPEERAVLDIGQEGGLLEREELLEAEGWDPSLARQTVDSPEGIERIDPESGRSLQENILAEGPEGSEIIPVRQGEGLFSSAVEGARQRNIARIKGEAEELASLDQRSLADELTEEDPLASARLDEAAGMAGEDEVVSDAFLAQIDSTGRADPRGRAGQPILSRDLPDAVEGGIETDFHRLIMDPNNPAGAEVRALFKQAMIDRGMVNIAPTDEEIAEWIVHLSPDEIEGFIGKKIGYDPMARGDVPDVPLADRGDAVWSEEVGEFIHPTEEQARMMGEAAGEVEPPPLLGRHGENLEADVAPPGRDIDALRAGDPEALLREMAAERVGGVPYDPPQATVTVPSSQFDQLMESGARQVGARGRPGGIEIPFEGPVFRDRPLTPDTQRGPLETRTGELIDPETGEVLDPSMWEKTEFTPPEGEPESLAQAVWQERKFPGSEMNPPPREVGRGETITVVDANDPSRTMIVQVDDVRSRHIADPNTGQITKEDRVITLSRVDDPADVVHEGGIIPSQMDAPEGATPLFEERALARLEKSTATGPEGQGLLREPEDVDGFFPEDVAREIEFEQNLYEKQREGGFKWEDHDEQRRGVLLAVDPLTDQPLPGDYGWVSAQQEMGPYAARQVLDRKSVEELEAIARFVEDSGEEVPWVLREALHEKNPSGGWITEEMRGERSLASHARQAEEGIKRKEKQEKNARIG